MKKLVGLLAALALLPSAQAGELAHSAEYRLRYQVDQDKDGVSGGQGSTNDWMQRFKLGSTFRSGEKLTGQLTLLHNSTWGHSGLYQAPASAETGDSGLGKMDGTDNGENLVLVNEAYGSWMASNELLIRFGRGALAMADGRVIGVNDWGPTPNAFEGVLFTWDKEFARFNAYGVKFAQLLGSSVSGPSVSDPEINSYGLNVDWKTLPEFLKMVNLHVIQVNVDADNSGTLIPAAPATATTPAISAASIPKESRMRYGLVVSGDAMNVDYRLTYAAHTGKFSDLTAAGTTTDREGSMIDAELGYRLPDWMNSRISFLYHTDTGDKDGVTDNKLTTYDPYFYDKHDNAGWMDIYLWGNLTYMQLRYTMDIMDDLSFAAQYLIFSQTEKTGSTTPGTNAFSGTAAATAATENALGTELDLAVAKKYEGGLTITARAGMFSPGAEYASTTSDAYTQFFLEGKMAF
ncbi:MAG: alginate export family protein [Bdellovibrionales bacterium]|nr:alginate export family protein [Bdellovibrionales bacterium]